MKLLMERTGLTPATVFKAARGVVVTYFATIERRASEFTRTDESLVSPQSGYSLQDVEETFGVPFDVAQELLIEQAAPDGTYSVSLVFRLDVTGHWTDDGETSEFVHFELAYHHIAIAVPEAEPASVDSAQGVLTGFEQSLAGSPTPLRKKASVCL